MLTQCYPTAFDGVISGDSAMRTDFSQIGNNWSAVAFDQIAPKDDSDPDLLTALVIWVGRCKHRQGEREPSVHYLSFRGVYSSELKLDLVSSGLPVASTPAASAS